MNPQSITSIAAMIVAFISARAAGIEFFSTNPDVLHWGGEALTAIIVAALIPLANLVSKSPRTEKVMRLTAAIWNVVRAEAGGGATNDELRAIAIGMFRNEIGASNLGWRGWIFRIPGLGNYLIGNLFDALSSGYRRLLEQLDDNEVSGGKARAALNKVRIKNGA